MSTYLLQKARPSEDAVSGLLVDLIHAWPDQDVLLALLGGATAYPGPATWQLVEFDDVTVAAWPGWTSGEPDVILAFQRGGVIIWRVVLEAKLGAGKSSIDGAPVGPSDSTRDQLAKYQREAVQRWPGEPITVVYLTHDAALPESDLKPSLAAMWSPPAQGAMPCLVWCSWRDVEKGLRVAAEQREDRAFRTYVRGMADVLRSVGMFRFSGA